MATILRLINEDEIKLKKAKLAIKSLISGGVFSRQEIRLKVCQHCTQEIVDNAIQELINEGFVSESAITLSPGDRE